MIQFGLHWITWRLAFYLLMQFVRNNNICIHGTYKVTKYFYISLCLLSLYSLYNSCNIVFEFCIEMSETLAIQWRSRWKEQDIESDEEYYRIVSAKLLSTISIKMRPNWRGLWRHARRKTRRKFHGSYSETSENYRKFFDTLKRKKEKRDAERCECNHSETCQSK